MKKLPYISFGVLFRIQKRICLYAFHLLERLHAYLRKPLGFCADHAVDGAEIERIEADAERHWRAGKALEQNREYISEYLRNQTLQIERCRQFNGALMGAIRELEVLHALGRHDEMVSVFQRFKQQEIGLDTEINNQQ